MTRVIEITVRDRIAWQTNKEEYICGNSDFVVDFVFDAEWESDATKTARFVHGDQHTDVVFDGSRCEIPKIFNTRKMTVGVFAGDLKTTTPAEVPCKRSILCDDGLPEDPTPDVYAQLMEKLNKDEFTPVKGVDYFTDEDKAEMVNSVISALPVYSGEVAEI